MPLSLQPDILDIWYFNLRNLLEQTHEVWKIHRLIPSGYKDKGIRIFELEARTQILIRPFDKKKNNKKYLQIKKMYS